LEIVGITAENALDLTIKRDGMEEVFSAVNKNRMDAVFTGKPDRIARNEPNFLIVLSDWISKGLNC